MRDYVITGPTIYAGEDQCLTDHAVVVSAGKIIAIVPEVESVQYSGERLSYPSDTFLVPGMIDLHIHGARGADVMDADPDALNTIANALVQEGTTGFLATTMTAPSTEIEHALQAVCTQQKLPHTQPQAQVLGVHLEGPFLSAQKPGAQDAQWVVPPDLAKFQAWQASHDQIIRLVTVAPETQGALPFIQVLSQQGVVVSVGHTACISDTAQAAIEHGACHATHLYNAMSGLHHREPGAALALLLDKRVLLELIADGVHLSSEITHLTLRVAGAERIVLVTDAMRAKCMGTGVFDLGGQKVIVKGNEARLENGVLAGSVLTLNRACQHMLTYPGVTRADVVRMASINPAKQLGLYAERGSIAVGKRADLVVFDAQYQIVEVFVAD